MCRGSSSGGQENPALCAGSQPIWNSPSGTRTILGKRSDVTGSGVFAGVGSGAWVDNAAGDVVGDDPQPVKITNARMTINDFFIVNLRSLNSILHHSYLHLHLLGHNLYELEAGLVIGTREFNPVSVTPWRVVHFQG